MLHFAQIFHHSNPRQGLSPFPFSMLPLRCSNLPAAGISTSTLFNWSKQKRTSFLIKVETCYSRPLHARVKENHNSCQMNLFLLLRFQISLLCFFCKSAPMRIVVLICKSHRFILWFSSDDLIGWSGDNLNTKRSQKQRLRLENCGFADQQLQNIAGLLSHFGFIGFVPSKKGTLGMEQQIFVGKFNEQRKFCSRTMGFPWKSTNFGLYISLCCLCHDFVVPRYFQYLFRKRL